MATSIYVPLELGGRAVVVRNIGPRRSVSFALHNEYFGVELAGLTDRDLQGIRYALELIRSGENPIDQFDGLELTPPIAPGGWSHDGKEYGFE